MNPFADNPSRSELRFLLDAVFFKNMPPSSTLVAAYDTWKYYMLMPDGQIRDTAQPRIYRTAPNGNLSAFTDIAGAVHRKLAGIEPPGVTTNLKHVPRAVAASISKTLVPNVDAVVQMLDPLAAAELIDWFKERYYNEFLPHCQQAHDAMYRPGAVTEEISQWRSPDGNPLLLGLFHHTTDLMLGYKREWYPKAGLHTELDTFEEFTTSAAAQKKPNFPHVPWLWPDESGEYRTHAMYLESKRQIGPIRHTVMAQ